MDGPHARSRAQGRRTYHVVQIVQPQWRATVARVSRVAAERSVLGSAPNPGHAPSYAARPARTRARVVRAAERLLRGVHRARHTYAAIPAAASSASPTATTRASGSTSTRPTATSRGLVVVIHGGFWKAEYGAEYGAPLAEDLVGRGWTAANVEYRRVGNGGGFPETLDDIHAAIGAVATDADGPVITLGHSAGGHLATWAGARGRFDRWADGPALTHVISQAGVLDLEAAVAEGLGADAAQAFLGDDDPATYEQADPLAQVPLDVPVWAVHATDDDIVPFAQATAYVDAATAAGGEATLVEVHRRPLRGGRPDQRRVGGLRGGPRRHRVSTTQAVREPRRRATLGLRTTWRELPARCRSSLGACPPASRS